MKKGYRSEENVPGYTTVVTDKSKKNLPTDLDREKETNLPPGSATPNSPTNDSGDGRKLPQPSFNGPASGSKVAPRSLPTPGEFEGSPTKFDYNYVTRRTMHAWKKATYKQRRPWKKQRKQPIWKRLEDKRDYQLHRSLSNHKSKMWYKRVRKNHQFKTLRQKRRQKPKKYERRKVGDMEMLIEAYTPTSISQRRHRQHGPKRMQTHRRYLHNRAKAHRQHKIWYQRNKNKPAFKRKQKLRRQHPQRFHMRPGAYVPGSVIGFVFGPMMQEGQVNSIDSAAVSFSPIVGNEIYTLSPAAFMSAVVFDSEESSNAMFEVLDDNIGVEAYDDLDMGDLEDIAALYQVAIPMVLISDPDAISDWAASIVEHAMESWNGLSESPARVAALYLQATGEIIQYDQRAPGEFERPDIEHRPYKQDGPDQVKTDPGAMTHTPTPGGADYVNESGVNFPASSAKVIPESMKYAVKISDITKHVSPEITKRSKGVTVRLSRADPENGMWIFKSDGSNGDTHTIRIKAEQNGNTKDVSKMQIKVSCSCDFFRFQGPEHYASTNGYLYGKMRGTGATPTERDPNGENWLCKHARIALDRVSKYKAD